ncbi:trigger factor [candidate division LCP-89 bacterium B3_LCP]|uniref:Trigger factor n=1 Tax=candidate division LCP-89 bacterium B3_LCP TaxID=2012998 RepID=A0A532V4H1_UNCL8|nr:MAG: trigger factor [candidate division LCP-89 bacterium B3_LCP]
MKVEKEHIGGTRWSLTIEVPSDDTQTEVEKELKKLQKNIDMPGFRRGRVPLSMVRQKYERSLQLDILGNKIGEYYDQAIKEADIGKPVAVPEIEIDQLEAGKPLKFKADLDVEPTIELAAYDSLTVVRQHAEIGAEQVEKQIDSLREKHAIISEDDGPATESSLLEANVQELDAGFVPIIGHKQEDVTIDLRRASDDFRQSLIGIKSGESRNVSLMRPPTSPNDNKKTDYFQVSVKSVKTLELPELNDDFAKQISNDVDDLKSLQEAVSRELTNQVEAVSHQRVTHLLAHQVVDNSHLDVPESMLKEYLDRIINDARKSSPDNQFDEEHVRSQFRDRAVWNLKWYLIRRKIAENENLKVEDDDVQREFERQAAMSGKKVKEIQATYDDAKRRSQLDDDLLERKILNLLLSRAKIIDKTIPFDEFFSDEHNDHPH